MSCLLILVFQKKLYKFVINEVGDFDGGGAFTLEYIAKQLEANEKHWWSPLTDDGDFRSNECVELLKQSDIVVTNPPFSLFREYIKQLFEHDKKFAIICKSRYRSRCSQIRNKKNLLMIVGFYT